MTSDLHKEIRRRAGNHRNELIDLCKTLVEFETPSDAPDRFNEAFGFYRSQFEKLGFQGRRIHTTGTGGHLYLRPKNRSRNEPRQLILGHMDTVWDLGTLEDVPFQIQDDNRATGPGLFDMKAGLAQLIVAFQILEELGIRPPLTPIIFVNSDEEIGSPSSTRYIRCLARLADRCFVLEPAMGPRGEIKTERKGVGHFEITIEGRASHAGISPEKGSSAILELSHLIQSLNKLNSPESGVTVNVGVIEGGARANVVAPMSRAEVDVRVRTDQQARQIEEKIRKLEPELDDTELTVEGRFRRPPMEFNDRNKELWKNVQTIGSKLGLEIDHTSSGGASDGNTASQFTATVDGLGPIGDGAHESYEYIDIEGLVDRTALLAGLLAMDSNGSISQTE